MKAFCMDLHISVIEDFKTANPNIDVTDWCMSGHNWVMNKSQSYPEHINQSSWSRLNEGMICAFQEKYDSFLKQFDFFIMCHVTAFAMIYEKYNKPILMINSCRYDLPFCFTKDHDMIHRLNSSLQRINAKGLLVATSNNRADQLYTLKGCGIQTTVIPSLCLYTKMQYNPTTDKFLQFNGPKVDNNLIVSKTDLGRYNWLDIAKYKAIIHFPYEISTMSMFEHYFAGIPLIFPSQKYLKANRSSLQSISAYWQDGMPSYFEELNSLDTWIDLSDIYNTFVSPNVHYFDSIDHLHEILNTFKYIPFDMKPIHDDVKSQWENMILHVTEKG